MIPLAKSIIFISLFGKNELKKLNTKLNTTTKTKKQKQANI